MTIRLKDIAEIVGVKAPTVSRVLNRKDSTIQVSEATRKKIFETAQKLNYQPSAAARALATKRSGYIGYIMSDTIEGGWQNANFSRYLSGIERACRKHGYGLNISLYNLSNIETFIFPERIGQRSIDGLILTGHVEAKIVKRFKEFKIPMIILGRDTELTKLAPGISPDDETGVMDILQYVSRIGHKHILWCMEKKRRSKEKTKNVLERLNKSKLDIKIQITYSKNGECNYQAGKPLVEEWLQIAPEKRPTLIMSTDQTMTAALQELSAQGCRCPEDVSLVSVCDSRLCLDSNPPMTALDTDMEGQAEKAVMMLIDHLDSKKPLTTEMQIDNYPCKLIERKSCKQRRTE